MSAQTVEGLIDRVVGWFSPEAALKRRDARKSLAAEGPGGYRGGKRSRRSMTGWQSGEGSGNADLLADLPTMRSRSRDLARNNPLARGAVSTTQTNVIGTGLVPRATIDGALLGLTEQQAEDWERQAEREFALAVKTMDWTSVQNFYELQDLWLRSILESGDVLLLRRFRQDEGDVYGLKVQTVEADRLMNENRIADSQFLNAGVQTDVNGRPVAYHVTDTHPGDLRRPALTWRKVPARYSDGRTICLHLFERLRPDTSRGEPYLAPVIEDLKELGSYSEAEARAAAVAALWTVFLETPEAGDGQGAPGLAGEAVQGSDTDVKLGAGAVVALAPGEEVKFPPPGRPNPAFEAFITAVARQIGVGLDLPYELLIKHFSSSYSASRAALEIAWQAFRRRRTWFVRKCLNEIWEWVIEEAVLTRRLDAPGFLTDPIRRRAWVGVEWIAQTRVSLDPLKDAKADQTDIETGVKTRGQVMVERTGGDWESKTRQLGREQRLRAELGLGAVAPAGPAATAQTPPPADAADPADDETEDENA